MVNLHYITSENQAKSYLDFSIKQQSSGKLKATGEETGVFSQTDTEHFSRAGRVPGGNSEITPSPETVHQLTDSREKKKKRSDCGLREKESESPPLSLNSLEKQFFKVSLAITEHT